MNALGYEFYRRECLEVARDLVGKVLVRRTPEGELRLRIRETEAYCGESDTACHAHRGRTIRTEVLYADAGTVYVYLCYGMHWMMNVITGAPEDPQGVLLRAGVGAEGPGRLTKYMGITGQENRTRIYDREDLYIEDDGFRCTVVTNKRVGIAYAAPGDRDRLWRFIIGEEII